jgi:hypothetical protein
MGDRPVASGMFGMEASPVSAEAAAVPYTHRGVRAVQRLVEFAPATGGLALWVQHDDLPDDEPEAARGDPHAAPLLTDGHRLLYRPAFEALPLPLATGWVAHAVLHVALRHPQRARALQQLLGDVDPQLFNLCADAIVNSTLAHLGWLALPRGAITLDALLSQALGETATPEVALLQWDVERLYRAVDDRRPGGSAPVATSSGGTRERGQGRSEQTQGRLGGEGDASPSTRSGGSGSAEASARDDPRGNAPLRERLDAAREARRARLAPAFEPDDADDPASTPPPPAPRLDGPRAARTRMLGAGQPPDLVVHPHSPDPPEAEAEAAREWFERLLRAHANDGEFSMLRVLLADLPRSRTPWTQVLRRQAARALAPQPSLSWSRPTRSWLANQGRLGPGRRLPWEPGRSAVRAVPSLVLVVDVSGSIEPPLLRQFAREVEALTRRLCATLVLVVGDERVRAVQRFTPGSAAATALGQIAFQGGGGTDFRPLLAEAVKHRPDLIVVLTDLDGPVGEAPRVPVIWAVPEDQAPVAAALGGKLVVV